MNKDKLMDFNENIQYIFHTNICECDMVAASVSVCERYKLLTDEKIEWLKLLPKEKRTVEMGKMQKDKSFSDKMISGLLETRDIFINENRIKDEDIISLHSDALFIINKHKIKTKVNGIEFKIKNSYSSYIKYDDRMEMFYTKIMIQLYLIIFVRQTQSISRTSFLSIGIMHSVTQENIKQRILNYLHILQM